MRIEWGIKLVIAAIVMACFAALSSSYHLGRVSTFLVGPMLMLGGVLWWTAGLITRKPRYFSARVLWCTTIILLVLGTPVLLFVMDVIARKESFGSEYWSNYLVLVSPAVPLTILAIALHFFGKTFARFKSDRLASWED